MSIYTTALRDARVPDDESIYAGNDNVESTIVDEAAPAGQERCSRRSKVAGVIGGLLLVATVCAAIVTLHHNPAALTVATVSLDGLQATYSRESTELLVSTTNSSMAVSSGTFALSMREQTLCCARAADGSCSTTCSVTTTTIKDKAFVSLQSATGKRVTVRLSGDALLERNLDLMFSHAPEIAQRVRDAKGDMEVAMQHVREQHQQELKAWVDAAWNLDKGALNINGMALPHVLPFVATARDLAKQIEYQPVAVQPERLAAKIPDAMDLEATAAIQRRRLDEIGGGFHGQWGDGSCQRGGLPTDEGPSALRAAYRTDDCRGLCGPGCDCWSSLCGNCCWHQYCFDHDNCGDEISFLSVVFRYSKEQCSGHFQC